MDKDIEDIMQDINDYKPTLWETIKWTLEDILEKPHDLYREIKYFIQRGRRGYSDRDMWDLGQYINHILLCGCTKYRKDMLGYPGFMTEARWTKILDEIIEGCNIYDNDVDGFVGEPAKKVKIDRAFHLLARYYDNMWD